MFIFQVDWIVCNMVAIRQGSLGHLRYVMKATLQALPLYGHYFYQHGCIYVNRGDFKQKKMESALDYLSDPKIKVRQNQKTNWVGFNQLYNVFIILITYFSVLDSDIS